MASANIPPGGRREAVSATGNAFTGIVADPAPRSARRSGTTPNTPAKPSPKSPAGTKKGTPAKKSSGPPDAIGGVAAVLGIIVAIAAFGDTQDAGAAIGVGFVAFIVSGLGLVVAYYVLKATVEILKVAIQLAFGAVVIVVLGNLLGFEWAGSVLSAVLR